ncbi:MAG: hypothetical protein MZW92_06900 [Comamonadaceae bacterium]|nr:hypothetical protein [Comamonadaceae bacterium]
MFRAARRARRCTRPSPAALRLQLARARRRSSQVTLLKRRGRPLLRAGHAGRLHPAHWRERAASAGPPPQRRGSAAAVRPAAAGSADGAALVGLKAIFGPERTARRFACASPNAEHRRRMPLQPAAATHGRSGWPSSCPRCRCNWPRARSKPTAPLAIVEGPPQRLQVRLLQRRRAAAPACAPGHEGSPPRRRWRASLIAARTQARTRARRAARTRRLGLPVQRRASALRDDGLLLETGGSLRLFGGRARLQPRDRRGSSTTSATAPQFGRGAPRRWRRVVALAAGAARGRPSPRRPAPEQLPAALDAAAARRCSAGPADTVDTLHALGLRTLRRPAAAAARRRAHGASAPRCSPTSTARSAALPDPQPPFEPPARFFGRASSCRPTSADTAQLMFPAQRLLRLARRLPARPRRRRHRTRVHRRAHSPRRTQPRGRRPRSRSHSPRRSATRSGWRNCSPSASTACACPSRRSRWRSPSSGCMPFAGAQRQPAAACAHDGAGRRSTGCKLAETLHARLGSARVFQLQAVDDHRPERAWRAVPIAVDAAERHRAGATPAPIGRC